MNKIIHPFFVVLCTAIIIVITAIVLAIDIPKPKKKIVDREINDMTKYSKFIDSVNHNQQ
jgi:hypothetical protein